MEKSITPSRIKQNNRNLIYQFIYQNNKVSQQDISYSLRLSRPTVTANLNALEADGLIQKDGQIDSDFVGRKAAAYSIVPEFRISIGVELLEKAVKIIAVNLYGEKINRTVYEITYRTEDTYFQEISKIILSFKDSIGIADKQILGIGFAMQALVSADNQTITYGKILSCTGLTIDSLTKYLPYPCSFIHDANGAAISELWCSPELQDAFYLSLSKHLGAAIIANRSILVGKHGHSSTIEHIPIVPDGELCYCGKKGCMETICSLTALLDKGESLEDFFHQLQKNNPSAEERWQNYLTNLARIINNLHLVYDTDFILGGYLAPYLSSADLHYLHDIIAQITPFDEPRDFLLISKMPEHNIAIGAALPYIQKFLSDHLI